MNVQTTPAIPGINANPNRNFFLFAGPCVVENETMPLEIATEILKITTELNIPFVFKASYRKANRSKSSSFSGIGDEKALSVLADVKDMLGIPLVTDIHSAAEAAFAAQYVDVLQIPAFLCRQTDLLEAAAATGKWINIKKGQFLSPESMVFAVNKVMEAGNHQVLVTDRGTMFGYQDLVVDMRGIPAMQAFKVPVILDITHSLQQPNQAEGVSGGKPELISTIARAGIAAGADGIFLETHPNPAEAKSDGANMLHLKNLKKLLTDLVSIRQAYLTTL
ncbi:MAG: 3-deoxy-8-phosphooctulonate synthase [Lentimicrobiaceae bacterium]|jgi:2-dehydro-3-deoxyphosphooctonate aldolase (KDO 8-P synthase)|nr:3-deoxy-8-phosphooctulonate synthase [Lentimicrobiaceae bacterium]MDD4598561.1 3-deoxy-8-phosphooctulonate synthase [Lentimicrobiaceae bacterium]MDY0026014.1 3-deoxy-8-phosphooctulonate synthase [Lentimicrobium sp.]